MINLNDLRDKCFRSSIANGWYSDKETGEDILLNIRTRRCSPYVFVRLALINTEIREAGTGYYGKKNDKHLPHRSNFEVELSDIIIRILDLCGALKIDIDKVFNRLNESSINHYHFINKPNIDKWFFKAYDLVAYAVEDYRKGNIKGLAINLSELLIIVFDINRHFRLDVIEAAKEKLAFNAQRADHKPENCLKCNGKKF